jgi:hypothetical protein
MRFVHELEVTLNSDPACWYVLEGMRSMERSAQLYAAYQAWLAYKAGHGPQVPPAPRAAPPGSSAHNYGFAVDVVLDIDAAPGLQPSWDVQKYAEWSRLRRAVEANARLVTGADFKVGDPDWPHIEWKTWRQDITHKEGS